jgi:transcriptional regulator GlxA family with amidase domain
MLRYPKVSVQPEILFVRDGKFFTSAGGSACLDLALRLIEEDLGNSIASSVAGIMVLFAKRTGGQPQISATLCAQKKGGHVFGDLLAWMADNAHRELTITKLAKRAAMSPRNFSRTFVREIGTTPAKHIKALRVEAAQRELEAGTTNLTKVAEVSGFTSTETLRRAFLAEKDITPGKFLATMT